MKTKALLLFSEGLDSILAGKLLTAQGIQVLALRFITPFFGWSWHGREEEFARWVREEFGFEGQVLDITRDFLPVLTHPKHGYGSAFNPCIDCRILMLRKAKALLPSYGAHFLATGEVVGQRPMTQQRPTLRHIEKEAGVLEEVVRPLCARKLWETIPEREGLVDRSHLLALSGRGRKRQLALAREFGLRKIPSPAGGCLLTDVNLAERFRGFVAWKEGAPLEPREAELLTFGRHFRLGQAWLVLGRVAAENQRLTALALAQDTLIKLKDIPGPTGLILGNPQPDDLQEAASLVVRYAPKARNVLHPKLVVQRGDKQELFCL